MKITGSYTIDAPREEVWAALNDIDVLARIVPGCERLEQTGENEYVGTVKIGIQTIKGTYNGRIRIEDIQPPHHYRLVANGRSANGVVDGAGTVDLAEQDGKTILTYGGDAQIGGMLASVGQRLIEGASKQMINQSLKALVEQIGARRDRSTDEGPSSAQDRTEDAQSAPDDAEQTSPPNVAAAQAHVEPSTAEDAQSTPDGAEQVSPPNVAEAQAHVEPSTAQEAPQPPPAPQQPQPSFERRTVVVPDHEQLKPTSVARGVVDDLLKERPWLPWVAIAFLLGVLLGRSRR